MNGIGAFFATVITLILLVSIPGCMYVVPQYNVYSQKMDGEAELAKAESTRRTKVLEAQALKDSAGKAPPAI